MRVNRASIICSEWVVSSVRHQDLTYRLACHVPLFPNKTFHRHRREHNKRLVGSSKSYRKWIRYKPCARNKWEHQSSTTSQWRASTSLESPYQSNPWGNRLGWLCNKELETTERKLSLSKSFIISLFPVLTLKILSNSDISYLIKTFFSEILF